MHQELLLWDFAHSLIGTEAGMFLGIVNLKS